MISTLSVKLPSVLSVCVVIFLSEHLLMGLCSMLTWWHSGWCWWPHTLLYVYANPDLQPARKVKQTGFIHDLSEYCQSTFPNQPLSSQHTVATRPHTVAIRPHTVAIRPHTVAIRPHTVANRPHTVPISPHTVPTRPHTVATRPHSSYQATHSTYQATHSTYQATHSPHSTYQATQ